ncbi:MAG: alpha/beta hydrolase [Bryobacterales bacterium]|nr:alpha/beta hydrolase [Bryobacterales bacterium]
MNLRFLPAALAALCAFAGPPPSPVGWTDGYVMANGIRIHYWRTGGSKPVMVMLHGSSDDGRCWTNLAKEFTSQYDIIMWDARGHGLSDAPTTVPTQEGMVEDLNAFLRALKIEKPILMGHSMGSGTAAWFASRYPAASKAVILEDPNLGTTPMTMANSPEDRLKRRDAILAGNNRTFDELFGQCMKNSPKWGESECAFWAPSKQRHHPNTVFSSPAERPATRDMFKTISAPVLILKADAPADVQAKNEEVTKILKAGRIVHITGAGHNVRRENKAQTIEVMRAFLASVQ